jgi:glycosyltransferase involved in cell wall biosynthesis
MKIAQVITRGDTFYGAQTHVLDLCKLLIADGHDTFAVVGSEGGLTDRFTEAGVPYVVVPSLQRSIRLFRDMRCIADLEHLFRERKPDLVATHSSKAGIVGRLAAHRAGVPTVFTAHGWSFEEGIPYVRRRVYLAIERYVAKRTDKIIAVSELGRSLGIASHVAPSDRIEAIHYGVPESKCQRVQSDVFTMTMVAGFREQKDHRTLIAALQKLSNRKWIVNFLGDGELLDQTKALVRKSGLGDRIHFHGAVNNVADYLAKSDLKVLITNWEGLPISIIEALALGLPVIASDVSGVSEEVIDGYNGLLTARGDVESVRHALEHMMDRPDLRDTFGKNSRQLFEERFTLSAMYSKTRDLYLRVIGEVRP